MSMLRTRVSWRASTTALTNAAGPPTVDLIQEVVADVFGLTREELVSPSRTARVAWPRQVAMYLAREHTHETLPAIGRCFGGRNHTTVLHAHRRITTDLAHDPNTVEAVDALRARLDDRSADRA